MKNSLICFSTVEAPTRSSSRMQSLFCRSVCVCTGRGMGVLKSTLSGGGNWSLYSSLLSPKGCFSTLPLFPSTTSPRPLPFPLFSLFQGEFILSLGHCGEWRDWLAKGWPRGPLAHTARSAMSELTKKHWQESGQGEETQWLDHQ